MSKQGDDSRSPTVSSRLRTRLRRLLHRSSPLPSQSATQISSNGQTDDGNVQSIGPTNISKTIAAPDSTSEKSIADSQQDATGSDNVVPSDAKSESSLWQEALEKTDKMTKARIDKYMSHEDVKVQINELIGIVREREKEFKDKTHKIKIGDREIIWRDYANRVVSWITDIGNFVIKFAPSGSEVVWSALKVLLKAHVDQCQQLTALLGCAEKVLRLVRRGKVYEAIYIEGATETSFKSSEGLREALVNAYQACLSLLALTADCLQQTNIVRFLHAIENPRGEGNEMVGALSKSEALLSREVQACEAEQRQTENAKNRELLQRLNEPLRYIDQRMAALFTQVERRKHCETLDFISSVNIGNQHQRRKNTRLQGTCDWLLEHQKFLYWETSSRSSIFWLNGEVGAGKSVLTSKVVDRYYVDAQRLIDEVDSPLVDEGFAFFYCSKGDADIQDDLEIHLLRSLLRQLATVPHYPTRMEQSLIELCDEMRKKSEVFSVQKCQEKIVQLINILPRTIFVLDALDECDKGTAKRLVKFFTRLMEESKSLIKIYVSSRDEQHIRRTICSNHTVEITINKDNHDDIERYISTTIEEVGDEWSSNVKLAVAEKLSKGHHGMFRWAFLQIDQLKSLTSAEAILDRLENLPEDLVAAYDEIYNEKQEFDRILLQRAVRWVSYARKPLSTEQLLSAVRLQAKHDDQNVYTLERSGELTKRQLAQICCHLINEDVEDDSWKFAHASVLEYFQTQHQSWMEETAKIELAKLSLLILIERYSTWPLPEDEGLSERPLHYVRSRRRSKLENYVSVFWPWHIRATQAGDNGCPQVAHLLKRFMAAEGEALSYSEEYRRWIQHASRQMPYNRFYWPYDLEYCLKPNTNLVFWIIALNLYATAKTWMGGHLNVQQLNWQGLDALAFAARYGHDALCVELIKMGSDTNRILHVCHWRDASLSTKTSALGQAVMGEYAPCVRTLLEHNADPNLHTSSMAICEAAQRNTEILGALLEYNSSPNLLCPEECRFNSALEAAACRGSASRAELLINAGAIVDADLPRAGTALAGAAFSGSLDGVKILVKHGADVNAHLKVHCGSVLASALFGWGDVALLKFLIEEAKADPQKMISIFQRTSIQSMHDIDIRGFEPDMRNEIADYLISG
ncbi:ankyrin protein [Metarhizium brunneum]